MKRSRRATPGTRPLLKNKQNQQTKKKKTDRHKCQEVRFIFLQKQLPVRIHCTQTIRTTTVRGHVLAQSVRRRKAKEQRKKRYDFLKGVLIYALGKKRRKKNNGGRTQRSHTLTNALRSRRERKKERERVQKERRQKINTYNKKKLRKNGSFMHHLLTGQPFPLLLLLLTQGCDRKT